MSIAEKITRRIEGFEAGVLFAYTDFQISSANYEAMAAAFSRLASKGIIRRFGKGKYFKPEKGAFGEVPLTEKQIIESITMNKGIRTAYLTGVMVYNKMGLTNQMANEYTIAAYGFRKPIQKGRTKVRFVKAYGEMTESNVPLLQLLDALKDIRNIPGTEANAALNRIKAKIKELTLNKKKKLTELALNYPPSVRALTGAVLELIKDKKGSERLYKSLNFLSKYEFGLSEKTLPNRNKWRIV